MTPNIKGIFHIREKEVASLNAASQSSKSDKNSSLSDKLLIYFTIDTVKHNTYLIDCQFSIKNKVENFKIPRILNDNLMIPLNIISMLEISYSPSPSMKADILSELMRSNKNEMPKMLIMVEAPIKIRKASRKYLKISKE